MRGILKNIQKTPERMYSKNLVTDRFTMREITNGLTWWAKANYYFASHPLPVPFRVTCMLAY